MMQDPYTSGSRPNMPRRPGTSGWRWPAAPLAAASVGMSDNKGSVVCGPRQAGVGHWAYGVPNVC